MTEVVYASTVDPWDPGFREFSAADQPAHDAGEGGTTSTLK